MAREMEENVGEGDRGGIVRWQEDIEQLATPVRMTVSRKSMGVRNDTA